MEVGFLGLGHMGEVFAKNLLDAGHSVTVWNRSPEPMKRLGALGAQIAASPADAFKKQFVFTLLADDRATRAVVIESGAYKSLGKTAIHANLATISIALADELTKLYETTGATYLATPVFGRPEAVANKLLNVVAAGSSQAIDQIEPLLLASAQKVWRVGEKPQDANIIKLAGNFMIACAIESMAEAMALVRSHGVEAKTLLEILTNTMFAAPAYKNYGAAIANEKFTPAAFALKLGLKDVRLALEAADQKSVPLPFASFLRDSFMEAVANGAGDKDWSALAEVEFRRAGLNHK